MNTKLSYSQNGDYLIPNIKLSTKKNYHIGKYGMMRKSFLKQFNPMVYSDMALSETLYPHLEEIDETANKRLQVIMEKLMLQNPAPDKKVEQMKWVQYMNTLKAQAEEAILSELIYC